MNVNQTIEDFAAAELQAKVELLRRLQDARATIATLRQRTEKLENEVATIKALSEKQGKQLYELTNDAHAGHDH